MAVAVTGGTGFIGRILVRNLSQKGIAVRVLTRRPNPNFPRGVFTFQGDLTDPSTPIEALLGGVETIYHCAGEQSDPRQMHLLHVKGTERLIQGARVAGVKRWVQLSSVGVYGPNHVGRVTEDTPTSPQGIYETTKTKADRLISSAAESGAFQARFLRPANVIGSQMPNASFRQLIAAVARGYFFFIGEPGALANYVASENVAVAMEATCDAKGRTVEVFNLAETVLLEDIVASICDGLARPVPQYRIPLWTAQALSMSAGLVPGFPLTKSRVAALTSRVSYASDKLVQTTSYKPEVDLNELVRTLAEEWSRSRGSNCAAT